MLVSRKNVVLSDYVRKISLCPGRQRISGCEVEQFVETTTSARRVQEALRTPRQSPRHEEGGRTWFTDFYMINVATAHHKLVARRRKMGLTGLVKNFIVRYVSSCPGVYRAGR